MVRHKRHLSDQPSSSAYLFQRQSQQQRPHLASDRRGLQHPKRDIASGCQYLPLRFGLVSCLERVNSNGAPTAREDFKAAICQRFRPVDNNRIGRTQLME